MEMDLYSERTRRRAAWTLFGLALAYAFVAGLRTVADFDVGWLLSLGRYLVTHHAVPRTDVLSYTAYGTPWIYPPFGGALLYLVYTVGGFAALSWINAFACTAVVAVTIGRPRLLTCALAILAVPSIAFRTAPRAELFTTFFFAAYLALLWKHRREEKAGKGHLWLLPLMMLVWVNAHSGFTAGIALLGAYVAVELLEFCFASRRFAAVARLKAAAPWIVLSVLATAMNSWGIGVYRALAAHNKLAEFQSAVVSEWAAMRLTPASFAGALQLRDPNSGYWWLLVFAGLAAATALYRRQFGEALLLAAAAYLSVEHVRFQALFVIVVIVIAGEVFSRPLFPSHKRSMRTAVAAAATVIIAALALLHMADTITDRSYLANGELSSFGAGLSWWYPQGATQFIASNALPAQIFHDYASGGYLTLRLGPKYPDFADGRGIPFPLEVLTEQSTLVESPPDSALWTQEADRYGINTIILSLARIGGLEHVPLREYCESSGWKPVYLDDVSIVLVRNRPENQSWIERFKIDCANYRITPPNTDLSTARDRADAYNFYANTASIDYVLGRDHDAFEAASHAEALFKDDPGLPLLVGQLLQANGKLPEAEAQYRRALRMHPTDTAWFLLAQLMLAQKNYPQAASALKHAADLALFPAGRYQLLGNVDLAMHRPKEALAAFDSAERFGQKLAPLPNYASFNANVAEGRGRAWLALQDAGRATAFLEQSARLAPDPQRWNLLADCYSAQGRTAEAEQARARARELLAANQKSAPALPPSGLSPPTPASPR
jgi:tetratricopeptide (TPR) repeat protein